MEGNITVQLVLVAHIGNQWHFTRLRTSKKPSACHRCRKDERQICECIRTPKISCICNCQLRSKVVPEIDTFAGRTDRPQDLSVPHNPFLFPLPNLSIRSHARTHMRTHIYVRTRVQPTWLVASSAARASNAQIADEHAIHLFPASP